MTTPANPIVHRQGAVPDAVVARVQARLGTDPKRVRSRLVGSGITEPPLAAARLDSPAWQALIDRISVQETYFFRHSEQLERVASTLLPDLVAPGGLVQVWCAGCSTGEEAYTVALLLDAAARHAGGDWRVLATDISARALAVAREGRYGRRRGLDSFRAIPAAAGGAFAGVLEETASEWSAPGTLRSRVRFDLQSVVGEPPYRDTADLVICRNLLIYMDEDGRARAQAAFSAALRPGGLLLLGVADQLQEPHGFKRAAPPEIAAYRKALAA